MIKQGHKITNGNCNTSGHWMTDHCFNLTEAPLQSSRIARLYANCQALPKAFRLVDCGTFEICASLLHATAKRLVQVYTGTQPEKTFSNWPCLVKFPCKSVFAWIAHANHLCKTRLPSALRVKKSGLKQNCPMNPRATLALTCLAMNTFGNFTFERLLATDT